MARGYPPGRYSAKRVSGLNTLFVGHSRLKRGSDSLSAWGCTQCSPWKVLSQSHLTQPVRLVQVNPPSGEWFGKWELLCPVWALRASRWTCRMHSAVRGAAPL